MLVANQLYATVAIIFHMWYLLGGIVVAPFGFFAVHKLNRRLILIVRAFLSFCSRTFHCV